MRQHSRYWVGFSAVMAATGLWACSASDNGGGPGGSGGTASGGTAGSGAVAGSGAIAGSGGTSGSGGGAIDGGTSDSGTGGACTQNIDIVFAMDVSTSMGPFLTKLASEIDAVDTAVKNLNLTSTPHYGLVVFVDDVLFVNSAAPYPDAATLKQDFQTWSLFTSSNQQTGGGFNSNTTWPENSLDALAKAAGSFAWRPEAGTLRIVIHTTDDTFWEGPSTQNGVPIQYDYDGTIKQLQAQKVRVFSFASKIGGSCECQDVSAGWFSPYKGLPAIPDATGGGVFELDKVLDGSVSLSNSINDAVEKSLCKPYPDPT